MGNGYRPRVMARLATWPWRVVTFLLFCTVLAGCGETGPFELEAVRGKVSYSDGSLIEADQILVKFVPQDILTKEKVAPRSSETQADPVDGRFSDLTTWEYADGVMVGRHKVVVISLQFGSRGVGEPSDAVPARYHEASTTPLEVEVTSGGDNDFSIEIEKGN